MREERRDRNVRQPQQARQRLAVAQDRVDLLSPHDRHRDDRLAGAQRGRHEAATAEALQLVPLREGLADALEALGEHPDDLVIVEQPLGVRVAGEGVAALARQRRHDREGEDQVGTEQAQRPLGGVVVVQRQDGHEGVDGDGAGVVGDDQRAARVRDVVQPAGLDAEPLVVERAQRRQEHVVREVAVEAELIDLVITGDASAQERQAAGELALPARFRHHRRRRRRDGSLRLHRGLRRTAGALRCGVACRNGAERDDACFRHLRAPRGARRG